MRFLIINTSYYNLYLEYLTPNEILNLPYLESYVFSRVISLMTGKTHAGQKSSADHLLGVVVFNEETHGDRCF